MDRTYNRRQAYESVQAKSYGLAGQDVLDVADGARRLDRRARENGQALPGLVQHLLNVGDDASNVRRDKGILEEHEQCGQQDSDNVQLTVVLRAVAARCNHHMDILKDSSTGEVSPMMEVS